MRQLRVIAALLLMSSGLFAQDQPTDSTVSHIVELPFELVQIARRQRSERWLALWRATETPEIPSNRDPETDDEQQRVFAVHSHSRKFSQLPNSQ